jgi:hypothetical protein
MKSPIFWDIMPCSPLIVKRCFGGTYRFHLQGRRISRAKKKRESRWQARQPTTRRYVPQDRILHNHRCENLKTWKLNLTLSLNTSEPRHGRIYKQTQPKSSAGVKTNASKCHMHANLTSFWPSYVSMYVCMYVCTCSPSGNCCCCVSLHFM